MHRLETTYRVANGLGRAALALLDLDLRVHGAEHLPRSGPVVLAATHVSFLDFVVLEKAAVSRGRRLRFLTQVQAWSNPVVGWAMDRMRHVPVDREAPAAAYLAARRLLGEGEAVGVFPEAGISHAFTVRALMPGAVALARETGAPLVPAAVWGPQQVTSVGDPTRWPDLSRGRAADVQVGPPLDPARLDDVDAGTDLLGHTLSEMLEALQRLPRHRPRPGEQDDRYPRHLGGWAPDVRRGRELDELPFSARSPTWGPPSAAGPVPGPVARAPRGPTGPATRRGPRRGSAAPPPGAG